VGFAPPLVTSASREPMRGARFHRVNRIGRAVREALRDMPEVADNGAELDALAGLPAEQQAAAVAAVKSGGAPNVRVAIATTAQPTLCAADNADSLLEATLEQIRRLGHADRERLWDAAADQWHEEISRAVHPPSSPAPSARRERDGRAPIGIAADHRRARQQDRRNAAAGGAERLRHAEPSRCRGRPGATDQRPVLRAGLCRGQCRMGGAAAAAT